MCDVTKARLWRTDGLLRRSYSRVTRFLCGLGHTDAARGEAAYLCSIVVILQSRVSGPSCLTLAVEGQKKEDKNLIHTRLLFFGNVCWLSFMITVRSNVVPIVVCSLETSGNSSHKLGCANFTHYHQAESRERDCNAFIVHVFPFSTYFYVSYLLTNCKFFFTAFTLNEMGP